MSTTAGMKASDEYNLTGRHRKKTFHVSAVLTEEPRARVCIVTTEVDERGRGDVRNVTNVFINKSSRIVKKFHELKNELDELQGRSPEVREAILKLGELYKLAEERSTMAYEIDDWLRELSE